MQSLASDHFCLFGVRGAPDPPLLSTSEISSWDTHLDVLGWLVDAEALTVTSPPHKRLNLRLILAEWPPARRCFSEAGVTAGGFPHAQMFCRSSRVFLRASFVGFG